MPSWSITAFPHFPDPAHLIQVLAGLVKPGDRLSVAHSMSRAALFAPWFDADVIISNDRMYQVSGVRREGVLHTHGDHSHVHGDYSEGTPIEELLVLMKYMVGHNNAHCQELADRLREVGKNRAYDQIMDVVTDFDMVNAKLGAVLKELTGDCDEED